MSNEPVVTQKSSQRGIALLIVVSILSVIGVMGVSFVFSMFLEMRASSQFSAMVQARYAAEAGISHARALLDEDGLSTDTDDLTEPWSDEMIGDDIDVDANGTLDAQWWLLADEAGEVAGRYGVLIIDEASKVNLNSALSEPGGNEAANLTTLLSQVGIGNASELAEAIEAFRYGADGQPGVAQVDDDGDGLVDESDEFQALALFGDDQRLESLQELVGFEALDADTMERLSAVATVYSWDANLNLNGQPRVNVNTAKADELLSIMLETGGENPWQMAVNMADFVDGDLTLSQVSKTSKRFDMTDGGDLGTWSWQTQPLGHYETSTTGGTQLPWTVGNVPAGTFQLLVHGVPGMKVGDVTIDGQTKKSMDSGESFGELTVGGTMTVRVANNEASGTACAFVGVEVVSDEPHADLDTVVVRGIEAIRVNEVMVAPTIDLSVDHVDVTTNFGNSGWTCDAGLCSNSLTGEATWTWRTTLVPPGKYHLRVYGSTGGQTVGLVNGSGALFHGDRHAQTIEADEVSGSDPKETRIQISIDKTVENETYYFQKVSLSLEPDAEYVELINLSDLAVDIGGWILEGAAVNQQAQFPVGTTIGAHDVLVAAVDKNDTQTGLSGNGVDVQTAWEVLDVTSMVQLEFPGGAPTPDVEWLAESLPDGISARIALKSGGRLVDEVEYPLPLPSLPFQSLEKGDPTVILDADGDGLDESWYPSLQLYTPGEQNDNSGMIESLPDGTQVLHDPATDVNVPSRRLSSVGELVGLSSGVAWQVVSSTDLAKIVDRLTVLGHRLETEAAELLEGTDSWTETADGYEKTQGSPAEAVGTWQWLQVPDGPYRLSVYGWADEQLALRWLKVDGTYTDWTPSLAADAQGRIVVGQVIVGMEETPSKSLTLDVRCDSPSGVCHCNHIWLDPQLILVGMVNVNTAPLSVLRSLPLVTEAVADRIVSGRPYGNQDDKRRGIGDLLIGSVLGEDEEDKLERFGALAHLLTVRSGVFQIISLGQVLEEDETVASQRITAIVQR